MRLAEREISSESAGGAHADVRDVRLELRERRQRLRDERVALDVPVGRGRTDAERVRGRADLRKRSDRLHVDEVRPACDAHLHREEELGASRVDRCVLSETLPQGHRLRDRRDPMDVESSKHR